MSDSIADDRDLNGTVEVPQSSLSSTLESEIATFIKSRPFWQQFLCSKYLAGSIIEINDINSAYNLLLEDIGINALSERTPILIPSAGPTISSYNSDITFTKLSNVQGVNALAENQVIEFNPNLTILFGVNGSGKSGYVRLIKKAFFTRAPSETIQPNIYLPDEHKTPQGDFWFNISGNTSIKKYPSDIDSSEFKQFSVFDGKALLTHIDSRNEFAFRPSGLAFFSEITDSINKVEQKLNAEVSAKSKQNIFVDFFDGESSIKIFISSISHKTKIDEIEKFLPYSDADMAERKKIEQEYNDLYFANQFKDQKINKLETIQSLIKKAIVKLESINKYFTVESLSATKKLIDDSNTKDKLAKNESTKNFEISNLENIGSQEWKDFIIAASIFANQQSKPQTERYPSENDICLLCHQPLSDSALVLIRSYWKFIKSIAEKEASEASANVRKHKEELLALDFNLFPEDGTLSEYLNQEHSTDFKDIQTALEKQKDLCTIAISNLNLKVWSTIASNQIDFKKLQFIISQINKEIESLKSGEQNLQIATLKGKLTFFNHKEKLALHQQSIIAYIKDIQWIDKAQKATWTSWKKALTTKEKELSTKYFNETFVTTFNDICTELDGNFKINVDAKGSGGKSNRQLLIQGRNLSQILSEGEQKVIALADFITEMKLSQINKGLVFDDPVTSLDDKRKVIIANSLVKIAKNKQVIIFTHDLAFIYFLSSCCTENGVNYITHWVEKINDRTGNVYLDNSPTTEKSYKTIGKAQNYSEKAVKAAPQEREELLKNGFTALRTSYEALVVFDLFNAVVERFDEVVKIQRLDEVNFDQNLKDEVMDSFAQCCRYMEGHSHSDKYSYKKPGVIDLQNEIKRFTDIKKKIKDSKKDKT